MGGWIRSAPVSVFSLITNGSGAFVSSDLMDKEAG